MNFDFSILISNPLINVGVVSWMVAQLLKTIIHLFTKGEFKRERLAGAGGMPSSHSASTALEHGAQQACSSSVGRLFSRRSASMILSSSFA